MLVRATLAAVVFGVVALACSSDPEPAAPAAQDVKAATPAPAKSGAASATDGGAATTSSTAATTTTGATTTTAATDAGAAAAALPECCGGRGSCVASASVPADKASAFQACDGPTGGLCAPKEILADPNGFKGTPCNGSIAIATGIPYKGVCLSDCLAIPSPELISRAGCKATELCVPCTHPLTGEATGAPGCE